jgi:hypothetical protein
VPVAPECFASGVAMAFLQEFLRHYIAQHMEDPVERTKYWNDHTSRMSRIAEQK